MRAFKNKLLLFLLLVSFFSCLCLFDHNQTGASVIHLEQWASEIRIINLITVLASLINMYHHLS